MFVHSLITQFWGARCVAGRWSTDVNLTQQAFTQLTLPVEEKVDRYTRDATVNTTKKNAAV